MQSANFARTFNSTRATFAQRYFTSKRCGFFLFVVFDLIFYDFIFLDLLKHTEKSNPDQPYVVQAIEGLKSVLT